MFTGILKNFLRGGCILPIVSYSQMRPSYPPPHWSNRTHVPPPPPPKNGREEDGASYVWAGDGVGVVKCEWCGQERGWGDKQESIYAAPNLLSTRSLTHTPPPQPCNFGFYRFFFYFTGTGRVKTPDTAKPLSHLSLDRYSTCYSFIFNFFRPYCLRFFTVNIAPL